MRLRRRFFDVASFRVTGEGEPVEDAPEVQRVMLSDRVLDVARFPVITFESLTVALVQRGDDTVVIDVAGVLTLHGVTRPFTVRVAIERMGDELAARGAFTVEQTDFGIDPVGAAAGLVKTKNELDVAFSLHARPSLPSVGAGSGSSPR